MICTRLDVLSTRIEDMGAFIVFELLAEQICHRSSEKERRKVSAKNCVWASYAKSDAAFKRRTYLAEELNPLGNYDKR